MINRFTSTDMWVADERKEEYLAAGHKLAASSCAKPIVEDKPVEKTEPKKITTAKKTTTAKKK
jgi:hypothetical protein